MFTIDELNSLKFCGEVQSLEHEADRENLRSILIKINRLNTLQSSYFKAYEIDLLKQCRDNMIYTSAEQIAFSNMIIKAKVAVSKPQVIVRIEGGCVQYAYANTELELIIEDEDDIASGNGLAYPTLESNTQEEFDNYYSRVQKAIDEPKEIRVYLHDKDDYYPYHVMIDDKIVASAVTMPEALDKLKEYLNGTGKD